MLQPKPFFNNYKHLSNSGIYLYVNALRTDTLEDLPDEIYEHGQECTECGMAIMQLYETIQQLQSDTSNTDSKDWQSSKKLNSKLQLS